MFSRLHKQFGTAGLVIAVVALIAALVGTAIAAGGLTKQQEKQVTKIAKKYAGKPGAAGPAGPQGPAGAAGKNGSNGANGTNGSNGATGATGVQGIQGTQGNKGPTGLTGPTGPEGVCGTSNCVLPSGATETGVWGTFGTLGGAPEKSIMSLSFPIPLATELGANSVHYIGLNANSASGEGDTTEGESTIQNAVANTGSFEANQYLTGSGIAPNTWIKEVNGSELIISRQATASATGVALTATRMPPSGCTGGTPGEPKADAGNLCVYEGNEFGSAGGKHNILVADAFTEGASRSGASLLFEGLGSNFIARGSWAVTAP